MSIDRSVAVGVEIAGGRTAVALVDRHGRILHCCYAKTLKGRPAIATLEPYMRAIDTAIARAHAERLQVCGIGVSIPGSLDATAGLPFHIPILPSLNSFPLCDFLEARYHLPIFLHADVDAAIFGEYRFGAGQGARRLLFLTVNTVVGAALVVDGRLDHSAQSYTGHVCHLAVTTSGPRCSCGKRGCINALVSIHAMQRMVQRAHSRGEESHLMQRLLNRESFSHQLLSEEARRGDSVALQIYSEVGRWLGAAITKYINLFEPNVLILGGRAIHANEVLLTQVRNAVSTSSSSSSVATAVEVVPALLGSDAALIGATIPCL